MNQASDQNLQISKWLAGAAVGAAVMYMLDPERGAPRRAQSTRKLRELGRQTGDAFGKMVQGVAPRIGELGAAVAGAAGDAGSTFSAGASNASNATGASGKALDALTSSGGSTGMSGSGRGSGLSTAMKTMRGSMQGAEPSSPQAWGTGMRGAAMAGGGALGLYGLLSARSAIGLAIGLTGLTLLARGVSNRPLSAMLSATGHGKAVEVEKTIRIDASPEQVYDMFANYENFPRFMSNVVEVRDLGERRSHWVVKGPAGTEFAWNAVLTEQDRGHRLAWQSEPGAEVEQAGTITFEPFRNGTRVTVHMSYRPPAGAVGQAVASLLGSDPKRQMDEDLSRMKSLVERGTMAPGGQAQGSASEGNFLH